LYRSADRTALGMSHHQQQFGFCDRTAIFHAAEHFLADYIPGDSNAEDIAQSQIKDKLRWRS
jgi:hypothetical protein